MRILLLLLIVLGQVKVHSNLKIDNEWLVLKENTDRNSQFMNFSDNCNICNEILNSKNSTSNHIEKKHKRIDDHGCHIRTANRHNMNKHVRNGHGTRIKKVSEGGMKCKEGCKNNLSMNSHMEDKHLWGRKRNCNICNDKRKPGHYKYSHIKIEQELVKGGECNGCNHNDNTNHHMDKHIEKSHERVDCQYRGSAELARHSHMKINHVEDLRIGRDDGECCTVLYCTVQVLYNTILYCTG